MNGASSTTELKAVHDWVLGRVKLLVRSAQDREEIVASVMSDYWKYRQKNPLSEEDSEPKKSAFGLASQILRWRIADNYRSRVSVARFNYSVGPAPETLASSEHSPYRLALHHEVLDEITRLMTRMSASDRALLLRDVATDAPEIALSATERQQLARARRKLIQKIEARYGESLSTLNQHEDWENDAPD